MLRDAAAELGIELSRSFMVGDRESDAAAGLAAGCRAILLGVGPAPAGVLPAADLPAAVDLILSEQP
jgi:D-glycero-D-manno-heptose 1,7-bisphosphate phosphatase